MFDEPLLNDEQAAEYLGIEPRTLRLWRATRGLPYLRITSKIIRYRKSDLAEWVNRHRVQVMAA